MNYLLLIVGVVVFFCGVVVAVSRSRTEKPNGAMEWVLCLAGILLIVLSYGNS